MDDRDTVAEATMASDSLDLTAPFLNIPVNSATGTHTKTAGAQGVGWGATEVSQAVLKGTNEHVFDDVEHCFSHVT